MSDTPQPWLPETIETERLLLRPYRLEDADDVLAFAADEEWGRFLPVPRPYSRADAVAFLARMTVADRSTNPAWAIVIDERAVGGINIRFDFADRLAEMGWSIARPQWGRGLTTEAAQAVVDAAFRTHPDLNRVRAMADARNVASHRVMEKLGMRREGTLRQNRLTRGEPMDEAWFGILRSEWAESR